jgi:hypothetical protein
VPAFPADPEQTIQLPRLPGRRIRKRPEGQRAELIRDPELLQQVLDGLRVLDTDKENDADRRRQPNS